MMVTARTEVMDWVGKLEGSRAKLSPGSRCTASRCFSNLEIIADPGDTVTFVLTSGNFTLNLKFELDRYYGYSLLGCGRDMIDSFNRVTNFS